LADQDWIGPIIFKNFADQDWIGFNFIGYSTGLGMKNFTVCSSLSGTHNKLQHGNNFNH